MTPGLIVPVVPCSPQSSAVENANSTTGINWLNGSLQPVPCTFAFKYGMLYSIAKPHCSVWGCRSTSTSPASLTVVVLERDGMPTPTCPVTAKGRRYFMSSDKSPKPLPKNNAVVNIEKDSAPTRFDPLPPMSQSMPAEAITSCSLL